MDTRFHSREPGLPEHLCKEVQRLHDEFDVIYAKMYPNDDGDCIALVNDYIKANASKALCKRWGIKRTETTE